ncbi:hypothetical protein AVEN_70148-1 [Araneus ventricosus]|uniref:Uncharacterized protein n=1 Tax=Araneus ventricosus TaxID=182803 RepID=A0A4Y2F8L6_ARAVE|nr:hypothetical protein AVEN_70148-1 [Araneus ventricosus]
MSGHERRVDAAAGSCHAARLTSRRPCAPIHSACPPQWLIKTMARFRERARPPSISHGSEWPRPPLLGFRASHSLDSGFRKRNKEKLIFLAIEMKERGS